MRQQYVPTELHHSISALSMWPEAFDHWQFAGTSDYTFPGNLLDLTLPNWCLRLVNYGFPSNGYIS